MFMHVVKKALRPKHFFRQIVWLSRVFAARRNYHRNLQRIRVEAGQRKLRVVFFVNEVSKWKVQTLYDLMLRSGRFEMVVALDLSGRYVAMPRDERDGYLARNRRFFEEKGIPTVDAVALDGVKYDLRQLNPDLVFYQQPYNDDVEVDPYEASAYALTCYVPYFVMNYGAPDIECCRYLHRMIWRHFLLNEAWVRFYSSYMPQFAVAGKMVGLGHPSMDDLYLKRNRVKNIGYVIYAPHWSFDHPGNQVANAFAVSTFLENGKFILEYAERHRELKWVFKPHPLLYPVLYKSGVMTRSEVDAYFDRWRQVGIVHDTPDYQEVFLASKAMITDSCSFTTEYPATGHPLIHLICGTARKKPIGPSKELYRHFYRTHNNVELEKTLDMVIVRGEDPMREERLKAVAMAGLSGIYAAKNILMHLSNELNLNLSEKELML